MLKKSVKSLFRLTAVPLILIFLICIFPVSVQAQESELVNLTYATGSDMIQIKPLEGAAQIYEFVINKQVVMRYRTMHQGLTAKERAVIIFERAKKLGNTLKEGNVVVDNINGSFVVKVGGKLFITVTEADFRANNSTGEGLANVWAQNLLKARTVQQKLPQNNTAQNTPLPEVTEQRTPSVEVPEEPKETKVPVQEVPEISSPGVPSDTTSQDTIKIEIPAQEVIQNGNGSSSNPQDTAIEEKAPGEVVSDDTAAANAAELKMLELVNQERAKAGAAPLIMDIDLVKIARLKARDMIDKNYFGHTSPTYGDPFTMMKKFGIQYGYAGENLAGNSSVEIAHEALMASPGHRKNILNPNYTHIGIGIVDGGPYGTMFTQLFISKV